MNRIIKKEECGDVVVIMHLAFQPPQPHASLKRNHGAPSSHKGDRREGMRVAGSGREQAGEKNENVCVAREASGGGLGEEKKKPRASAFLVSERLQEIVVVGYCYSIAWDCD